MLQFLLTICDDKYHPQLTQLYNTFHAEMVRVARTRFKTMNRYNPDLDAEDVVQNTFLRVTKYIDKVNFSQNERQLRNYLMTILAHEIPKLVKSFPDELEYKEELCERAWEKFVEKLQIQEFYDETVRVIESLEDIYSTSLFLAYCEELSVKEISKIMEVPTKTVYTRLMRGKMLVRSIVLGEKAHG